MSSTEYKFKVVDKDDPEVFHNVTYIMNTCRCSCEYGCYDDDLLIYNDGPDDDPCRHSLTGADKGLVFGLLSGEWIPEKIITN